MMIATFFLWLYSVCEKVLNCDDYDLSYDYDDYDDMRGKNDNHDSDESDDISVMYAGYCWTSKIPQYP